MANTGPAILNADESIREEARRERRSADQRLFAAMILFPILTAALGVVSTWLWSVERALTIGAWVFVFILYAVIWYKSSPKSEPVLALILANSDLRADVEALNELTAELEASEFVQAQKSNAAFYLRQMSAEYISQGLHVRDDLDEMLSDLLAPLYLMGGHLLEIDGKESWSFSVYLYSATDDVLRPVWRRRSPNHPSTGESRSWERGQGHVGKAFVDRRTLFTSDAHASDVAQLVEATGENQRNYDRDAYRSFASLPFGLTVDDSDQIPPTGVLVATSSQIGRFDIEMVELIQHFADTLGVIFALTKTDLDCLDRETRAKHDGDRDDDTDAN
ncbi:MAG: GAF domain-containing protein [Pseudomonadota bacterium]